MEKKPIAYDPDDYDILIREERERDTHPGGADDARARMIKRMQPEPYRPKACYLRPDEIDPEGGNYPKG